LSREQSPVEHHNTNNISVNSKENIEIEIKNQNNIIDDKFEEPDLNSKNVYEFNLIYKPKKDN